MSTRVQEISLPNNPSPGEAAWFFHPDPTIDIAVIHINFDFLKERGIEPNFFANDQHAANKDKLKSLEAFAGDPVFVLGFPMNLVGPQRNYVIVRQGGIARISEMLEGGSTNFLIDAFVFPGNSGGPVVLRPEIAAITGTKPSPAAYLIGLVTHYLSYREVARSPQTSRDRIVFEENSGLAVVLPTDFIDATIKAWRARLPTTPSPAQ